jgi:hypothetical protein
MPENIINNKDVKNDEIDLMDLFKRMGKTLHQWGIAIGRALMISIVFLIRRWLPLGMSILLGIGISYLVKMTTASYYTSDLMLRNNLALMDNLKMKDNSGTTTQLISKINKLHTFFSQRNNIALSAALSLTPESIRNINDISAYWVIDQSKDGIPDYIDYKNTHDVYDTNNIRMQDRLDIRVKIKSPQEVNSIQNSIIKYIENDSLFRQRNRVRLKQNQDLLTRLDYDILQLDSLQKVKYFEETRNIRPDKGGQMIFLQEQKTQLVYSDIYTLYSRKQILESENDLYKGVVTVISELSLPARRDNGLLFYGKQIIPLFFCITLLILILLANRKKLDEIFKKY